MRNGGGPRRSTPMQGGRAAAKTEMRSAITPASTLRRLAVTAPPSPAALPVYNIFRMFQREGTWEAIWAELHANLRERLGRDASPTAGVIDSQTLKSAEKGAVKTTRWVTMLARS